jgi:class 3 adenylate cyclase
LKRTSLRRTILLYVSTILIVLIVAMLGVVNYLSESFVGDRLEKELLEGSERIAAAEIQKIEKLRASAATVAEFPELKATLETRHTPTLHDLLKQYHTEGIDLLILLDAEGGLVARSDRPDTEQITGLQHGSGIVRIQNVDETVWYHFAAAASAIGDENFGIVIAGEVLNDGFADALSDISGSEIVIVDDIVVGKSLAADKVPWQDRAAWESRVKTDDAAYEIDLNGEAYFARRVLLGEPESARPLAVVLQSYTQAIRPFRTIQIALLILGVAAAAAGIAASALLARKITAPVAKVVEGTQQVAAGNFDYRIDVSSRDEIGTLAESFNKMIVGLRERADMQKFVSQSTVDMIQATTSKKVSAGERVTLTILFSDMRGFTAMSENRPPEEIVRILNECLSLQAAKVKKFGGDIDKFVGDCVVALFTGEDMELKAIRCAVEIHKAIQERNANLPEEYPIQVGIGIATGEVILGSIGSEDRLDYTVIGSHVNLCSRICSLAGPGQTLMAQSTYDRLEGLVAAEKLEPVQVKGFKEPVPLYRMAVTPRRGEGD